MKHISKTALLFGALAMLVSTVPIQAMEEVEAVEVEATMPADIQQEVAAKKGFFTRWTAKARSMRLDGLRKELDKHWKKFMACVKKGEGCPRTLIATISGILASIIALVTVGAVAEYAFPHKVEAAKEAIRGRRRAAAFEKSIYATPEPGLTFEE